MILLWALLLWLETLFLFSDSISFNEPDSLNDLFDDYGVSSTLSSIFITPGLFKYIRGRKLLNQIKSFFERDVF